MTAPEAIFDCTVWFSDTQLHNGDRLVAGIETFLEGDGKTIVLRAQAPTKKGEPAKGSSVYVVVTPMIVK